MIDFSDAQKKTIATALTVMSASVVIAFVAFVAWMVISAVSFVSAAIVPVVIGLFLSLLFKPYYEFWKGIVKNPAFASLLMLFSLLLPLSIFMWHFGSFLVDQLSSLFAQAPETVDKLVKWTNTEFPGLKKLADSLGIPYDKWAELYKLKAVNMGVSMIGSLSSVVSWLVGMIFFMYFLTRPSMNGEDYVKQLPFLKDSTKSFVAEQIDSFLSIITSFFRRQVVICLVEGLYYGFGFVVVGVPYGFLLGFVLGVLNLIPLFGTIVCLPVVLTLSYLGDGGTVVKLICATVVWLIGQILDGYFITPKIQGDKTGLGWAGVIFSFIFWGAVFQSLLGLLLSIPLSAFCVVLWKSLKSKYIKPIV
jgi:predicted PurR-regulated permease PerM